MRFNFGVLQQFVCLSATVMALGCGGGSGSFKQAKVTGSVTKDGQPVTGGSLTFSPLASAESATMTGRPANGDIKPDGTFTMGTTAPGDGAVLGKHKVHYSIPVTDWQFPSDWNGVGEPPQPPKTGYEGLVAEPNEVEVKADGNKFDIKLVPGPPPTETVPGA